MMEADDRQHQSQGLQRLADIFARQRMLLHDLPLVRRQIGALLQDVVRNGNFAEIVQIAATAQGDQRFVVQADVASQGNRTARKPLAVALGVGVASFHAAAEGTENRFCRLEFVGEFLQLEQRLHAGEKLGGEDRLVQEVVGPGLDAFDLVFPVAQTSDQEKENQVGRVAANFYLGFIGVADGGDVIPAAREQLTHELSHVRVVVHHQDSWNAALDQQLAHILIESDPHQCVARKKAVPSPGGYSAVL